MPQLTISEEQVLELLKQLSPEGKKRAFELLKGELELLRGEMVSEFSVMTACLSEYLRQWASERGMDLDSMSNDNWKALFDTTVHEPNSRGV